MINVLLVCEFGNLNGAERSLLAVMDKLRKHINYSAVVSPQGSLIEEFIRRQIPVYPMKWKLPSGQNKSLPVLRKEFQSIVHLYLHNNRNAVEFLVHANSLSSSRMAGPVCQSLNLKSVGHIRDIIRVSRQTISDLNCNTRLICVSKAVKDYHVNQELNPETTHVVYNGVNLERFCPAPHFDNDKEKSYLKIGCAGQISLRKGMDVFLATAEMVELSGMKCVWEIAGSRQSEKAETVAFEQILVQRSARFPEQRFCFAGQLPELSGWLRGLDIYVHTARQEPLGRVLLEAAACGLPVVATDVGGTREIFSADFARNDKNPSAIIVPPNDPEETAVAILHLTQNAELRNQIGFNARQVITTRFADSIAAENLLAFYKEVFTLPPR